jgi:hypothetical protein
VNLKQSYIETFLDNFELAHRQARSLAYSARKIGEMMPLSPSSIQGMSEDQKEHLDAFLLRFGKTEDFFFKRLFRSILRLEGIKLQKSEVERLLEGLQQRGIISDKTTWEKQAELRNDLMHEYPQELEEQADAINRAHESVSLFLSALSSVKAYATERLGIDMQGFEDISTQGASPLRGVDST